MQYAQAVKRTNTYTSAATTVRINTEWGEWSGEWGGVKAHSSKYNGGVDKGSSGGNRSSFSRGDNGVYGNITPYSSSSQSPYDKNTLLSEVFGINISPSSA